MATICLKVATVATDHPQLASGHCYVVFPDPAITVKFLIQEKVRAELRKARAGGPHTSSLPLLIGNTPGTGPLDEQLAEKQAIDAFTRGDYLLLVDGRPVCELEETILLTRRTGIMFLVPTPEPTDEQRWAQAGIVIYRNNMTTQTERYHTWSVYKEAEHITTQRTEAMARVIAADLFSDLVEQEEVGVLTV